jgi:inosine-uridine nucleoside N-ribohydrolase
MTFSLIIDSDGGIDDTLAILALVASKKVKVNLINATCGNVSVYQAYKNIVATLELVGKKIQVSRGRSASLNGVKKRAIAVHGEDGLGNTFLANEINVLNPLSAVKAFRKAIEIDGSRKILAMGPLTNIAIVFSKYPFLGRFLNEIWLMGGTLKERRNVKGGGEFNFGFDPQATDIVFSSCIPLKVVTLDATQKVLFDRSFIKHFEEEGKIYNFLFKILNFSLLFNYAQKGIRAAHLPDLVTACLFLNEKLCRFKKIRVRFDKKTACLDFNRSLANREILIAEDLKVDKIKKQALRYLLELERR